ncbi:response regulator [Rhizobium ruizarguesonis]|uniref:response regulator n=1 Tax=Rhizobium ruizarguesonis TaxID=2081791 RepID=UPI0013C1C5EF|nr:response regulator [Rhizobium ruizarguesonis]NEJ02616.1 response regulator [Rhizobium ruizarguesonis]NEJ39743.1 response regulator [Rhizobium ruizarguesonis]
MKGRILIIEDEPLLAFHLEDLVHKLSYRVSGIANDLASTLCLASYANIAFVNVHLAEGRTSPRIGQPLAYDVGVAVTGDETSVKDSVSGRFGVISKPVSPEKITGALKYVLQCRLGRPSIHSKA